MNRKMSLLLFLLLGIQVSGVLAQEVFEGTINVTRSDLGIRKQGVQSFRLKIEITSVNDGKVQGRISSSDLGKCPNRDDEAVGSINENQISVASKTQSELLGCGKLNFKGTRQGDTLVGTTSFQGADRQIELKKK